MSNEFDDLNLDIDQPEPAPMSRRRAVSTPLYMLMAVLLAGACAYLVQLHGENRVLIQRLQDQQQRAQDQYEKLKGPSKEVGEALTELADHVANEAELHSSQGNRKQALADVEQARHLLGLAKKLNACSSCPNRETDPIDAKLTKLIDKLQPTQEETARLEPPTGTSRQPPGPPLEKKPQPHPEQPEVSGENNSGGKPDA